MGEKHTDHADIKIRPPFIYTFFIILGVFLNRIFPDYQMVIYGYREGGWFLIGVGACIAFWGIAELKKFATNIDPLESTTFIVSSGPFQYSRNPLYISLCLFHVGIAFVLGNVWILVLLIPAVRLMSYGVIYREEIYLEKKFKEEYLQYKKSVRRWL